jgi:hypothetical protein
MAPLPSGAWPIYVVNYVSRPPISRPIGVEAGRLVVLPEGSKPTRVRIRTIENNSSDLISIAF